MPTLISPDAETIQGLDGAPPVAVTGDLNVGDFPTDYPDADGTAKLEAVRALLAGTLGVADATTHTLLAAIGAALGLVPVSGPLTDAQLRAAAVPVSGPATDTQLRATPLPVSGPLTDAQIRATALPVSTTALPLPAGAATQDTLAAILTALASVAVTGPLTDAALRASAVPVSNAALPLPAGAATDAKVEAVRALLAAALTVAGGAAVAGAPSGNPLRSGGVGSNALPSLVSNGQMQDVWLSQAGAVVMSLAGTVGTGLGNGPGGLSDLSGVLRTLGVHPFGVNGAGTRDPLTRNRSTSVIAAGSRAATTNGPDVTNFNARGVSIFLNVTANPGGAETLTVNLQMKDSVTGVYKTIASSPVLSAAANGAYVCQFYPGVGAAVTGTSGLSAAIPVVLPETYRVQIAHSSTGSWTYSVGQSEIL